MSEINENEIKEQEVKAEKKDCPCKKFLKKTAVIALGTFIGVYSGLSLFAVTHKPKFKKFDVPTHYQMPYGGYHHGHHGHHMKHHKHFNGDFKGAPEQFKGDFNGGPKDFKGPKGDFMPPAPKN